ncbi:MAG: DEAD/DEAH box helicase [Gemmatimonadota bacterium]
MSFRDLLEEELLLRAIDDQGWTEPTPIQRSTYAAVASGKDVVGVAQTGTGKTAAFLLPVLERQLESEGLRTLVLCPTRELAQQVADEAKALLEHTDLWAGQVYGGVPIRPQLRDLRAGFEVLVATPGRLIDHLERRSVRLDEIQTLILDEADRMLDMGFRPQIETILRAVPKERQTLLFSATMPNGVHALALRLCKDPEWIRATPDTTAAETVEQTVYSVRPDRKVELLLELLGQEGMDQVLVFTRTKRGADLLHHRLKSAGIGVTVTHGDRDMKHRTRALESFAGGRVRVLVATDVAQRGLDIDGISHVVNYDVPQDPEDYVHRIGRTGRAGAEGDAITFVTATDLGQLKSIERLLGYGLPLVSLEGFDYAGAPVEKPAPVARSRSGRGFGSRDISELTPEERAKLFPTG